MNEAKQLEELPDDVKQEMLMLIETYSKNELIEKLRSLRKNISPEKTPISDSASSKDTESQLPFATVGTKSNNALPCSNSPISNSFSGNSGESSSRSYDCGNNSSSIPVTLQKSNLKKLNLKISLSETPHIVTEDIPPKNSGAKNRNKKNKLVNKPKLKSSNADNSSASKQPLDSIKLSNVSPKTSCGLKTRQQCFEARSNLEVEPETIPSILTNTKVKMKTTNKTTCNSSKNLNNRNIITDGAILETGKSSNAALKEPSVAVSNKNEINSMKSSDPPSMKKKKNVSQLKANKTENSYQVNATPIEPSTVDSLIADPEGSKIIGLKSYDKSPIKNKNLPLCDIDVPLIDPSTADGVNIVVDKNKTLNKKKSDSSPLKEKIKLLNTNSGDIQTSFDLKVAPNLKKVKKLTRKVNLVSNLEVNSDVIEAKKLTDVNVGDANAGKNFQKKSTSKDNTDAQALLSTNDVDPCKVSTNDLIGASGCKNTLTLTKLKTNNDAVTTRSSLRKNRNRILKSTETVSTSCLKTKIVKKKITSCSNVNKQPLTFAGAHVNQENKDDKVSPNSVEVSNSLSTSTKNDNNNDNCRNSDNGGSSTNCASLRKISDGVLSNSETVSGGDDKAINIKEFNCSDTCNRKGIRKTVSPKSQDLDQNTDAISPCNSKLGEKNRSCTNTLSQIEQDAEAYSRLSRLCSLQGLNIDDIFRRKEVKGMIDKYKNNADAIVFLGTHRNSSTGKVEPTVHVHKSKKILMETLSKIPDSSDASSSK